MSINSVTKTIFKQKNSIKANYEHLYYCNKKVVLTGGDGYCGPNDGPQCPECKKLNVDEESLPKPGEVILKYEFINSGRGYNQEYTSTFNNSSDTQNALNNDTIFQYSRHLDHNKLIPIHKKGANFEIMEQYLNSKGLKSYRII